MAAFLRLNMCFTYILYSEKLDKFYVGHTCEELSERLRKHNSNHSGYTSKAKDWQVVFVAAFENKSDAYTFELKIKSWKSRKRIQNLIQKHKNG